MTTYCDHCADFDIKDYPCCNCGMTRPDSDFDANGQLIDDGWCCEECDA